MSAIYLQGWLNRMVVDDGYIFTVAGRAGKLVDYLIDRKESEESQVEASQELAAI